MTREHALSVLFAVYDLAAADVPAHAGRIAARVGLSPTEVAEILLHLEARGLVDAGRARLTLRGLAVAHALVEHARRGDVARAA
jgi:Mn-dependent DtxR family transcriptional regulator